MHVLLNVMQALSTFWKRLNTMTKQSNIGYYVRIIMLDEI